MSEALRLASLLENKLGGTSDDDIEKAAAELRRLHAESEVCEKFIACLQQSRMRLQEHKEEFKVLQAHGAELVERLRKAEAELAKAMK